MATTTARAGRPSNAELLQRETQGHQTLVRLLMRALQHLNHPSRLADSPLCELDGVRRLAAGLRGYRFPRAYVVRSAIRSAYDMAWEELGETEDGPCLAALADALAGVAREESARRAGVSPKEISRRRREAVEIIAESVRALLDGA